MTSGWGSGVVGTGRTTSLYGSGIGSVSYSLARVTASLLSATGTDA
ncbi:MAG: hypothetical protein ABGZ53_13140 [Fuerstiella sp.]